MSQVSVQDIEKANPQIPTLFVEDVGSAIPVANTLNILGGAGIVTTGSGNTVTIALTGGGQAIDSIAVQTGTSPIVPTLAGLVTINGAVVVAGTNPIRSNGTGANTLALEVQISQALVASDATKIGLANFDSTSFTVDANGFVQILGGSVAESFTVDAFTPPGTNPVVATGGGIVTVHGTAVPAHTIPVQTDSIAVNSYQIEVQRASSSAATNSTQQGLASFDSSSFTVDANGWVQLAGGGLAIDSIGTQTGTNPIAPTAGGLVTINGAVVAAGTNPVRSDGTGANTMAIEVQISQALAASDATKIGLSNFDSAAFDVDANGFVQLNGGGIATTAFDVQANTAPGTDPVVPSASGVVIVNGAAVANHSVVLETRSRAANAYNLEVQYATSAAATDATKSGVAHFDSAEFTVDANGFVSLAGGSLAIDSIHPDSGTDPVVPTAGGLLNIVGTGSTTTIGSLNTLTLSLTGLTNHAIQIGAGTATLTQLAATATTGQVLQNNASADPSYSTATYPSTTVVSQLLYSSATNVVSGLATANRGVLTTGTTGIPVITALATDGQVIIGSTAGAPAAATLSAGTGITITNASNSITISASSSGFSWTDVTTATQTLAAENGYITDRAGGVTYTLPVTGSLGDVIKIVGKLGIAVITPLINQQILIGPSSGTVGVTGTATSNNVGDCIQLTCITAGASTVWRSDSVVGTWTLA